MVWFVTQSRQSWPGGGGGGGVGRGGEGRGERGIMQWRVLNASVNSDIPSQNDSIVDTGEACSRPLGLQKRVC